MTILYPLSNGWLINHNLYLNKIYSADKNLPHTFKDIFFDINVPFIYNSQSTRFKQAINSTEINELKLNRKRKRKISESHNQDDYHQKIRAFIVEALNQLDLLKKSHISANKILTPEELQENNKTSKLASQNLGKMDKKSYSTHQGKLYKGEHTVSMLSIADQQYVIPSNCSFCLDKVENLGTILSAGQAFDLIVMDPAWPNKSVKRRKTYDWIDFNDLLKLEVPKVASEGCMVAIWCTHNETLLNFIKDTLFPKWKVTHLADWHWLKITNRGVPILPIDYHHKKPYEHLILGSLSSDATKVPKLKNHQVIISIPSSIHSHKPPVFDILKYYLSSGQPQCLELFARSLLPGWTSIGTEVLFLQHSSLFEPLETKEKIENSN